MNEDKRTSSSSGSSSSGSKSNNANDPSNGFEIFRGESVSETVSETTTDKDGTTRTTSHTKGKST